MRTLVSCSALSVALFVAMLAGLELGRRWGRRRLMLDPDGARIGLGAIEGAVFGLMGLLLAFTFSGASARFDHRRGLIVREANAIGTAWLRLDLLDAALRRPLRAEFRAYLDARLDAHRNVDDPPGAMAALDRASRNQKRIW